MGDGPEPRVLEIFREIQQFGAEAVTGSKVLPVRLIRDMNIAQTVEGVYRSWEASAEKDGGWPKWIEDNPEAAKMLEAARKDCEAWMTEQYER